MARYLAYVEDDFDRKELFYCELIDVFGVRGTFARLIELRAALAHNAEASAIAEKRKFIDGIVVVCCPPAPTCQHRCLGGIEVARPGTDDWRSVRGTNW